MAIRWPGTELDPKDACQHGHQLVPGSDPITIKEYDPETGRILKEETFLLRRHLVDGGAFQSEFRPGEDRVIDVLHTDDAVSDAPAV